MLLLAQGRCVKVGHGHFFHSERFFQELLQRAADTAFEVQLQQRRRDRKVEGNLKQGIPLGVLKLREAKRAKKEENRAEPKGTLCQHGVCDLAQLFAIGARVFANHARPVHDRNEHNWGTTRSKQTLRVNEIH